MLGSQSDQKVKYICRVDLSNGTAVIVFLLTYYDLTKGQHFKDRLSLFFQELHQACMSQTFPIHSLPYLQKRHAELQLWFENDGGVSVGTTISRYRNVKFPSYYETLQNKKMVNGDTKLAQKKGNMLIMSKHVQSDSIDGSYKEYVEQKIYQNMMAENKQKREYNHAIQQEQQSLTTRISFYSEKVQMQHMEQENSNSTFTKTNKTSRY